MNPVRARRVELRRTNGQYEIYMGDRCVQTFCPEFENVVRYSLPEGSRQQVRINIEPLGEIRELATEESRDRMREFSDAGRERVEGLLRRSMEEVPPTDLSPQSLDRLVGAGAQVAPPRRSDSIQTEEGNIGWRATAIYHMEQEMNALRRMVDTIRTMP
jgi:hypothetical protein